MNRVSTMDAFLCFNTFVGTLDGVINMVLNGIYDLRKRSYYFQGRIYILNDLKSFKKHHFNLRFIPK